MQLMPKTATELGVTRILDPRENVEGGTRYLRQMLDAHEGDVSLALAAYNAGPEAVRRYRGIPPYRETREYVGRVIRVYERALGGVE
jgi:soluble lytic murein transglycosylase-like protein